MKYLVNYSIEDDSGDYGPTYYEEVEIFDTKEKLLSFIEKNPKIKEHIDKIHEISNSYTLQQFEELFGIKQEEPTSIPFGDTEIKIGDLIEVDFNSFFCLCKVVKIIKKYETIKLQVSQVYITHDTYKQPRELDDRIIDINRVEEVYTKEKLEQLIQKEEQRKQNNIKGYEELIQKCIQESDKIKEDYNKIINEQYK